MPNASTILAGLALVSMSALATCLIFHAVPQPNQQLVTFALGAISGALTVGGANKVADKITNSSGPNAVVTQDSEPAK